MRIAETIEVKQNLILTARERGKIVARREGHNIFVDLGREYLAKHIAFQSFSPDVAEDPPGGARVKYMGVGIGGTRQLAPATANAAPISPPYTGTNVQVDTDSTVTRLERPVRLSGGSSTYPGIPTDVWLGRIQAPATHPVATQVQFRRVFTVSEVNYSPFLTVPLSEIGLFLSSANVANFQNTLIAYDTFDTISKTAAVDLEVVWTLKF